MSLNNFSNVNRNYPKMSLNNFSNDNTVNNNQSITRQCFIVNSVCPKCHDTSTQTVLQLFTNAKMDNFKCFCKAHQKV